MHCNLVTYLYLCLPNVSFYSFLISVIKAKILIVICDELTLCNLFFLPMVKRKWLSLASNIVYHQLGSKVYLIVNNTLKQHFSGSCISNIRTNEWVYCIFYSSIRVSHTATVNIHFSLRLYSVMYLIILSSLLLPHQLLLNIEHITIILFCAAM